MKGGRHNTPPEDQLHITPRIQSAEHRAGEASPNPPRVMAANPRTRNPHAHVGVEKG